MNEDLNWLIQKGDQEQPNRGSHHKNSESYQGEPIKTRLHRLSDCGMDVRITTRETVTIECPGTDFLRRGERFCLHGTLSRCEKKDNRCPGDH